MPKIQNISVVVPAYNEEKNLRASIDVIHKYLETLVLNDFEILLHTEKHIDMEYFKRSMTWLLFIQ
jgi:hypothetical protein